MTIIENPDLPESKESFWRTKPFVFTVSIFVGLLILGAVGMYAWYFRFNPCEVSRVERSSTALISQLNWFDSAYQFAATSSKTALTRPVQVLQEITLDTSDIRVPACMQTTKDELVSYMEAVVSAFQAYMRSETDAAVRVILDESSVHLNNFTTELDVIKNCAPYCAPWD